MKTSIRILLAVLISGFIFNSCEKSASDNEQFANQKAENSAKPFLTPEYRDALIATVKAYTEENKGVRSAEFLPIFFNTAYFGFLDDDMINIVAFSTVLDENDFLRENPDGTCTVHISSNDATCELFNYLTYESYYGENGHMTMNYSGPATLIAMYDYNGNFVGYVYFVDPDADSPAQVWHGNGLVEPIFGGTQKNLVAKMVANAGWGKVKRTVNLN
jgi:hypothetical protein